MPTGAKTSDQRSDRYLGTSKWAPRLRHICRVGCTPTAPLSAIRRLRSRPQSVRLRLLIGRSSALRNRGCWRGGVEVFQDGSSSHEPFGRRAAHDAVGAGTPLSVRLVREDVAAGHLEGGCVAGEDRRDPTPRLHMLHARQTYMRSSTPGTGNGPTEAINGRREHLRAPSWASATSPTTSPGACLKPVETDPPTPSNAMSRLRSQSRTSGDR